MHAGPLVAITALRLANKVKGHRFYGWHLVSETGEAVSSSCAVRVAVDVSLQQQRDQRSHEKTSVTVVCGGPELPQECRSLDAWMRECQHHRIPIATIGGASFAPARAGLFQDLRWSIHWQLYPTFAEMFPDLDARQTLYEMDSGFYSCAGGDVTFDMFSWIVQNDLGADIADRICEIALKNGVLKAGERQRLPLKSRFAVIHPDVVKIIDIMSANLVHPLKMKQFDVTDLSRRQIERLFRQQLGRTPAKFYTDLRLERANLLVEHSTLPIIDIAIACGFVSASHFTRLYRKHYYRTPQQHRAFFRTSAL